MTDWGKPRLFQVVPGLTRVADARAQLDNRDGGTSADQFGPTVKRWPRSKGQSCLLAANRTRLMSPLEGPSPSLKLVNKDRREQLIKPSFGNVRYPPATGPTSQ